MKLSKQTNIFLAHTPLQNFIAECIVKQFFCNYDYVNKIYTSVYVDNESVFQQRTFIDKKGGFRKVLQFAKIKNEINSVLKKGNAQIFIPHTAALIDNYYYYHFPLDKYKVKINLYYEGILYFYEYSEPYKHKTHLTRKVVGYLNGFNYNREPEILPVNKNTTNHIYSILKNYTLGPVEKVKEISLLKDSYTPSPGTVLIMGGKPSLLSNDEVVKLYEEMINTILEIPVINTVYFKGHHADMSNNFEFANKNRLQIVNITQNSPVEEVIENIFPNTIVSYPSSGLVNLKAMYGDRINIISYYIQDKKEHLDKLWPIFEELQIKLTLI